MPTTERESRAAQRRIPLGFRLVSALLVAVILVAGIWIAGGKITNDFSVAMWLTVGWMALAALACLAIAVKRRELAVPLLGAYLVVAAGAGIYLGRAMFFDDHVNERVVTAAQPAARPDRGASGREAGARPKNVRLATGRFEPLAHSARGVATTIRRAGGGVVLTLTDFEVDNGPDLRVYLVAGPARSESEVDDFRDVGALKGNKGNQQYELPARIDLERYSTVVVWCRAFSVAFARAPLRQPPA